MIDEPTHFDADNWWMVAEENSSSGLPCAFDRRMMGRQSCNRLFICSWMQKINARVGYERHGCEQMTPSTQPKL